MILVKAMNTHEDECNTNYIADCALVADEEASTRWKAKWISEVIYDDDGLSFDNDRNPQEPDNILEELEAKLRAPLDPRAMVRRLLEEKRYTEAVGTFVRYHEKVWFAEDVVEPMTAAMIFLRSKVSVEDENTNKG